MMPTAAALPDEREHHWLVYDGQCAFCRLSVRWIQRFDWRGVVAPVDLHLHAEAVARRVPGTTKEQLLQALQLITPTGRVYTGFFAFRRLAWSLPPLIPLAPLLYLPGVSWIGPRVYAWIARHRYQIVKCTPDGACRL